MSLYLKKKKEKGRGRKFITYLFKIPKDFQKSAKSYPVILLGYKFHFLLLRILLYVRAHPVYVCGHFWCQMKIQNSLFLNICPQAIILHLTYSLGRVALSAVKVSLFCFTAPGRQPVTGESKEEYEILLCVRTALK